MERAFVRRALVRDEASRRRHGLEEGVAEELEPVVVEAHARRRGRERRVDELGVQLGPEQALIELGDETALLELVHDRGEHVGGCGRARAG